MDPLSQIIGLLKPKAVFWRVVEAHNSWTISYRPMDVVVFGQVIEGSCHVDREDGISFDLDAGDFMLMAAPPNWTMAAFGGGSAVDFRAAPKISIARRSAAAATAIKRPARPEGEPPKITPRRCKNGICDGPCMNARWITPSAAAAALRRLSVSSRPPRMGRIPLADNFFAAASDRASAVTVCPAVISSSVTAEPIKPVAPVTKTRM